MLREELKPGDLVFFDTMRRAFSHVGIYVGDGKFIHAPRSGGEVRIEDMRQAYWSKPVSYTHLDVYKRQVLK